MLVDLILNSIYNNAWKQAISEFPLASFLKQVWVPAHLYVKMRLHLHANFTHF